MLQSMSHHLGYSLPVATVCLLMICNGFRGISSQPGVVAIYSGFSTFREIYRKPLHIISELTVVHVAICLFLHDLDESSQVREPKISRL